MLSFLDAYCAPQELTGPLLSLYFMENMMMWSQKCYLVERKAECGVNRRLVMVAIIMSPTLADVIDRENY